MPIPWTTYALVYKRNVKDTKDSAVNIHIVQMAVGPSPPSSDISYIAFSQTQVQKTSIGAGWEGRTG